MSSIRIVIVDDHEVARRGIRTVLTFNPEIQVVAEIADGESAVRAIRELNPDIILLDISLPGISGIEVALALRQSSPDSRIIFVSQHDSALLAKDALRAGAAGYVVKSDAGRDLLLAIEAVREGRTFLSRTLNAKGFH
jgi:DNA-binding NarL/FixJ family response regulator